MCPDAMLRSAVLMTTTEERKAGLASADAASAAIAEALAGSEEGVPAKSRAVVQRLVSKWLEALTFSRSTGRRSEYSGDQRSDSGSPALTGRKASVCVRDLSTCNCALADFGQFRVI